MELDWLTKALAPFADGGAPERMELTKSDMYLLGLSGREDSERRRKALASELKLPTNLSANALMEAIRILVTKEEFEKALEKIQAGT
jgi:ribonuclease M5